MASLPVFPVGFLGGKSSLPISSDFKMRQLPSESKPRHHYGVDIAIPSGTIIKCPVNGRVIVNRTQYRPGKPSAGLYLVIEFDINSIPYYLLLIHLHETRVSVGQVVSVGQEIALSGGDKSDGDKAGSSTGAHLHLEIRRGRNVDSSAVDPKYWFLAQHTLFYKNSGKVIYQGVVAKNFFDESELRTLTSSSSRALDVDVIWNETEYSVSQPKKIGVTNERYAPGIWQITKLVIDSSVENKQVCDTGISTQTGSLLNFFRNVCQEPLVEFSGDTFVNKYYWMVRKPPYDKEGIQRMMNLTMINIEKSDILSTNLEWNTEGIYSWYQYMPYYELMAVKELSQIMPAVFFPQYAQVWGSKPLSVQSNYYTYIRSGRYNENKKENKENNNAIIRNAIRDFKYIVESNAYNPFTRRGTITIQGDRRIKRGTLVMLPTSGEIFYVDSVTNTYDVSLGSCSRTTTLQVSRGMYPSYVDGQVVGNNLMGYFELIDWGRGFDINKITAKNWKSYVSKWKVNDEVFNFFMAKQQVYFEHMNDSGSKYGALEEVRVVSSKK